MSAKWAVSGFAIFIGLICLIYRLIMDNRLKTHIRASARVLSCKRSGRGDNGFTTVFLVPDPATGLDTKDGVECIQQTNHAYEVGAVVPVLHPAKFPSHGAIYEPFIHKLFGSWLLYGSVVLLIVAQLGLIPDD